MKYDTAESMVGGCQLVLGTLDLKNDLWTLEVLKTVGEAGRAKRELLVANLSAFLTARQAGSRWFASVNNNGAIIRRQVNNDKLSHVDLGIDGRRFRAFLCR